MGETSLRPSASAGRLPMPLAPPTIGRCAPSAFSAISAAQVRPLLTTGRVRHHGSISHGSAHPPPPSLWRTGKARPYRIAVGPDLVSGPGFGADARSTSSSIRQAQDNPERSRMGQGPERSPGSAASCRLAGAGIAGGSSRLMRFCCRSICSWILWAFSRLLLSTSGSTM